MEYLYFNNSQPYHFFGLESNEFPPTSTDSKLLATEPPDPSFFSQSFDVSGFDFTPQLSSNDPSSQPPLPTVGSLDSGLGTDMDIDTRPLAMAATPGGRDSSEEKETNLTPAQSRRKAQNRAAQRAFRERKERHVKDLETKLLTLQSSATSLQTDNERLKLALQRAQTENEILRNSHHSPSSPPDSPYRSSFDDPAYTTSRGDGSGMTEVWMGTSAAWDLIMNHPLVKEGKVDIADVCGNLKRFAKCDGAGPVYEERAIWRCVESSKRGGGDELI